MTRLIAPALFALALTACVAAPPPASVQLDGAETRGSADRPRIVNGRIETRAELPAMELRSGDGLLFSGQLQRVQRPVVVPLATLSQPEGGSTELVGSIASSGEQLECRFLLLNPVRGVDGGGSGRCENGARRIDFTF